MLVQLKYSFNKRATGKLFNLARHYCHKSSDWENAKPYQDIPGPKPLPILGNWWRYFVAPKKSKDIQVVHKYLNEEYGDICIFRDQLGIPDMVLLYNPQDSEMMLRNEGTWPIRDGFYSMHYYRHVLRKDIFQGSHGLMNSQGKDWQDVRSKVNPIFMQPKSAQHYIGALDGVASDFIENMIDMSSTNSSGELPADFHNELNKWSFESIGIIALDRRLGCIDKVPNSEAQTMVTYMVELFKMFMVFEFTPTGRYIIRFNLPLWRKFVKYQDFFLNISLKYLNEAEEKIKQSKEFTEKPEAEKSVFERLLQVDKSIAMVMTLDMLSAGIDTTGKTIGAALYFLAKNKDVQDTLRKEVMDNISSPNTPITKDVLNNMPYLKAVVKETGRLAPIGSGHMRKTAKDLVLSGYQIPTGTTVIVPTLYLSTLSKNYPRPNEFIPERWLINGPKELSHKNTSPFITLPFGYGPRTCIGRRFANLELQILIAKVIRNFKLDWPHADMTFGQDLLYGIKDPLKLQIKRIE